MKISTLILTLNGAFAPPAHQSVVDKMVESFRQAGLFIEQDPDRFEKIVNDIDEDYVQMKWDYCHKKEDAILTASEKMECDIKLAAIYNFEAEAALIQTRVIAEPVIQRLTKNMPPSADYCFHKYKEVVALEILADVHFRFLAFDVDGNNVLDEGELGAMHAAMHPPPWLREFMGQHKHDFQVMWFKADQDGDLRTITVPELITLTTLTNMLQFEHFVLHYYPANYPTNKYQ